MFKVEFDIIHKGCWGSDISKSYPSLNFFLIDTRWIKNNIAEILLISGGNSKFNDVLKFLSKRNDVKKIEEVSRDENNLYIRVLTKNIKKIQNFSDIFFSNDCFPIGPIRLEDGYEKWILGSAKKENIKKIYLNLKKKHFLKIKYVKEEKFIAELTNKQLEILNCAKQFGYYEIPRRNSITKICSILKIPKTVFLSHLRKAEIKIINNYLSE